MKSNVYRLKDSPTTSQKDKGKQGQTIFNSITTDDSELGLLKSEQEDSENDE